MLVVRFPTESIKSDQGFSLDDKRRSSNLNEPAVYVLHRSTEYYDEVKSPVDKVHSLLFGVHKYFCVDCLIIVFHRTARAGARDLLLCLTLNSSSFNTPIALAGRDMDSQIKDLMNKAVNHALQIGAVFAEVRGEDTTRGNIEAVDNEIRTVSVVRNIGIGVRVFYGKGNGFSFSNVLGEESVFRAVDLAMKIAKASTKRTLVNFKLAEIGRAHV